MLKRILICDRCGKVIESEHPDRITISRHKYETTKDYKGIEHTHSVYKTSKSMHYVANVRLNSMSFGRIKMIKDSGDRREFSSGALRDMSEGKGRMDLLPWSAIMEVSKHCENGAKKYGEHNVDKGIPTHSFCDSAARHLAKYLDGWDDEPHLLAAAWNLLWAIQMDLKHPEMVDTPWRNEEEQKND